MNGILFKFKSSWRWWCGGGVIVLAVVSSAFVAWRALQLQPLATQQQRETHRKPASDAPESPHNGGKARVPIAVAIDDSMQIVLLNSETKNLSLVAEGDLDDVSVRVDGSEGLSAIESRSMAWARIEAGEIKEIPMDLPAVNGSLVVFVEAVVNGQKMTGSYELKVKNPEKNPEKKPDRLPANILGIQIAPLVERDSEGHLIQSSRAN